MSVPTLIMMSHKYGENPEYVLASGGNTSFKDAHFIYVKSSGVSLKDITEDGFVKLNRDKLEKIFENTYSDDADVREKEVMEDMLAARCPGEENKIPSVEVLLHNVLPYSLVLHLHPTAVAGFMCSKNAEKIFNENFADDGILIPPVMPGYYLATFVKDAVESFKEKHQKMPLYIFLQNHGVFTGGTTILEIEYRINKLYEKLDSLIKVRPDESECEFDRGTAALMAPAIRALGHFKITTFFTNKLIMDAVKDVESFANVYTTLSLDHMVYCGTDSLYFDPENLDDAYARLPGILNEYTAKHGHMPRIIGVHNLGIYTCGDSKRETENAKLLYNDAAKVCVYASNFGGSCPLPENLVSAINKWDIDHYVKGPQSDKSVSGRLAGKVAVVTGAAQGFGKGIAEQMASEGAYIIAADMNAAGAKDMASGLCAKYGVGAADYVGVNVADENQVMNMAYKAALEYGGIDVFVSNAGIARSGSLEQMPLRTFELMTSVNYTAFFLCSKYASRIMKIEHRFNPEAMFDIIQINSKSGLAGSNKNFAYAGSKFGGIGLVQSFALELVPENIKVNAICPGNFFDGPLWSDPEKGLFLQYLKSGKVPGATCVADVKAYYEGKVPMHRGCQVLDVARAIYYIVEQKYETGQAIPVTGGQEMLK